MLVKKLQEHIFVIPGFWTGEECENFITKSEQIGYEKAAIETDRGQKVVEFVRNNNRVLYTDVPLADAIWQKLEPYAPAQIGLSKAVGLNELFRFYKYLPGQQFRRHRDQSYIRSSTEASYYTFMIYLNDGYTRGETTFNRLSIKPEKGMALIFLHSLEHEGSAVLSGVKYVLRSDIMYRLVEENV